MTSQTHRARAPAARAHGLGGRVEVGLRARGAHDVGAGLGEGERDAAADALAGAGDDRDAVGQPEAVEDHERFCSSAAPRGPRPAAGRGRS